MHSWKLDAPSEFKMYEKEDRNRQNKGQILRLRR